MKRLIRFLIIFSFLLTSLGIAPGMAAPIPPGIPIFLPLLTTHATIKYSVSGTIRDTDGYPVAGVVVKDVNGVTAVTDQYGHYSIQVLAGPNTLTATKSGYSTLPLNLNVASALNDVNFSVQVGCGNIVVNDSVNVGEGGWDFLTDNDDVIAGTDLIVFNTAPSSGRTGIDPAAGINELSNTRARSQVYHIPSEELDSVFVGLWVFQVSTSAGVVGDYDHQYIELLDEDDNVVRTILFENLNTAAWTYVEYSLEQDLTDDLFPHRNIKIQVRTVNDGTGGVSAMYFDNVALVMCNTHCEDQIVDGGFELQTGWFMYAPQVISPTYTTAFAHTGLWSVQTGIPVGDPNVESFSEVFQDVNLPSSHSGALLTFWLYTTSSGGIVPVPALPSLTREVTARPETERRSPLSIQATPENDTIYVYVLDEDGESLRRLFFEEATDTNGWTRYSFTLSEFMGEDIQLLFGTYNDGDRDVSAMYIDDVILGTCD